MAEGSALDTVTVTGRFLVEGQPVNGLAVFTGQPILTGVGGTDEFDFPAQGGRTFDIIAGDLSAELPITGDSDYSPQNWTWTVQITLDGAATSLTKTFQLPEGTVGPVSLRDLVSVDPGTGTPVEVPWMLQNAGDLDLTGADVGQVVTLATVTPVTFTMGSAAGGGGVTQADLAAAVTSAENRVNHTGAQTASTISDFTEAAQDAAGALITNGSHTGITAVYDDASAAINLTVTAGGVGGVDLEGSNPPPSTGTASALGVAGTAAHSDHTHGVSFSSSTPATTATSGSAGSASLPSRGDHVHAIGAHTHSAGTITYAGGAYTTSTDLESLLDVIDKMPRGIVAHQVTSTDSGATSAAAENVLTSFQASAAVVAGRRYRVEWSALVDGTAANDRFSARLRYTLDGTAPGTSSANAGSGAFVTGGDTDNRATVQTVGYIDPCPTTGTLIVAPSLQRITGSGTATVLGATTSAHLVVDDKGGV